MSALVSHRRGLWLVFFLNGAVLSSWAPRIPAVKEELALSDSALGLALWGIALGSVPTLLLTARLLRRVSARTLCRVSALVFAAGLPLIAAAENLVTLTLTLVLLGAASGMLDIAMNAAALGLERAWQVTLLPGLHGGYSLGMLCGAGMGALAAGSLSVAEHFGLVTAVLLGVLALAWSRLAMADPDTGQSTSSLDSHRRWRPSWALVAFALCALLTEGLIIDWSAVLLRQELGATATVAGLGVTIFSAAMTLSRALGNKLVTLTTPAGVARGGAAMVTVALLAGLLQPHPEVLLGALVLVGLGCGPLFPLAISTAARNTTVPLGTVTASLTAWGYLAYLGGPPLAGTVADHLGLSTALLILGGTAAATMLVVSIVGVSWTTPHTTNPPESTVPPEIPDREN
ncbi:MFS transporter [Saccharomonospora cyanea]|uniref:Arabinose efflux permease family protein n=1 Tax=Saccharomonospora cyanea NA-134 TaxID=882082 RepID=H5XM00_9PSEU|nr:MFS transporter [Saccharomonospora cyanea]EHR62042.1 arabinose efflux permease family protein [Saccharomonospora cyanea NA-134]